MALFTLPVGKQEIHDGTSWYALASENWVLNTLSSVAPCRVATTTNLTATYANGTSGVGATLTNSGSNAPLSIDGVSLSVNDRVLVKDQTAALQNGIYTVTTLGTSSVAWVLTRAADFDSSSQMTQGKIIAVINNTSVSGLNNNTLWVLSANVATLGTTTISFFIVNDNSFASAILNPCLAASTQNLVAVYANGNNGIGATLTYSGSVQEQYYFQVDSYADMPNGSRVLVKDQTVKSQNGVYVVTDKGSLTVPWVLTRVSDYDTSDEMSRNQIIPILNGTTLAQTLWMNPNKVATVGTSDVTFNQFRSSGLLTAEGVTNQITVSILNGKLTIGLATDAVIPGNGALTIPKGTTVQRPTTPVSGMIRFNTSLQ